MSSWSGNAPVLRTITTLCNQAAADFLLSATTPSRLSITLRSRLQLKNAMVLRERHNVGSAKKAKALEGKGKKETSTRTRVSNAGNRDNGQDRS